VEAAADRERGETGAEVEPIKKILKESFERL
jgi:hypothetical protein